MKLSLIWLWGCLAVVASCRALPSSTNTWNTSGANHTLWSADTSQDKRIDSIWSDVKSAPATIGSDLVAAFSTPLVWYTFGAGYASGEVLDVLGVEDSITSTFADHSIYPDPISKGLEQLGQGYSLFLGAGGWYVWSHVQGDAESVSSSQHLLRSLASTGISTLVFKELIGDERPNGGQNAFPSGHTSMAVAAATSLWMNEGPRFGVPAAILSGLIALQRLDSNAHELDDVIGGAALGWSIAYTLERREPLHLLGADVYPNVSPSGDLGVTLLWSY